MKPLLKFALLALPVAAACNSNAMTSPSNSAEVRVINASPDAGPLDFYFQSTLGVDSLPYSFANPYVFVQSGTVDLAVRAHGAINLLLESAPTFNVGSFYTYIVTGPSASLSSVLLTDDTVAAPSGSFKLRMVHAAPAGPAMDLYYTGPTDDLTAATPMATAVAFKSATAYLTPAIGSGRLRVTQAGTKTVVIDSGTLTFLERTGLHPARDRQPHERRRRALLRGVPQPLELVVGLGPRLLEPGGDRGGLLGLPLLRQGQRQAVQ